MNAERDHHDVDAIAVLRNQAPSIEDADPRSKSEREVNRMWAALRRAGERNLTEIEKEVRQSLQSVWPELRIEAQNTLCRWGREDAIQRARDLAEDPSADEGERRMAREALTLVPK